MTEMAITTEIISFEILYCMSFSANFIVLRMHQLLEFLS